MEIHMNQEQQELYQELERQGMPIAGCKYIVLKLKTKEQRHIMMKYLMSIREEQVSVTQVSRMVHQIAEM